MINKFMQLGTIAAVAALSLTALAPAANAQGTYTTIVTLDQQIQTQDIDTPPAGYTLAAGGTLTTPFSFSAVNESLTGSLTSRVFRNNTNNQLDFLYQFSITSGTLNAGVSAINLNDFGAFTVGVAYDNDLNIDGTAVTGQPLVRPFGAQKTTPGFVAFAFNGNSRTAPNNEPGVGDGNVLIGRTSAVLAIRTTATLFSLQNGAISGNASGNANILGATTVPEAGSLVLLLPVVALGAVTVIRRKK